MSNVIVVIGAGSIGQAIARRVSAGKHVLLADLPQESADAAAKVLKDAGFSVRTATVDVSKRASVHALVQKAVALGEVTGVIHAAGVSPTQSSPATILGVDLYGTALVLEAFGNVIAQGGAGVVIASQSGHRLGALTAEQDKALATTPVDDLLALPMLQPGHVKDSLHAYQLSKRGNSLRVMAEAVKGGKRGARLNTISPGIIITPLANDELAGPRGDGYRRMIELCPVGRAGTPDEVGTVGALPIGPEGAVETGSINDLYNLSSNAGGAVLLKWNLSLRLSRESVVGRYLLWVLLLTLSSIAYAGSPMGSNPIWLGNMGNTLFFIAQPASSNPVGSAALFRSDGTAAGTTQIAPIDGVGVLTYRAGTLFISAGTKSYFLANTTAAGQQVWVTDGSSAGTHPVTDIISTNQTYGTPILLGLIGTNLVFAQIVSNNTMQLFLTDGTAAGTTTLSSFAQDQYGLISDSIAINNKVYVALESNLACCAPDLWATDGTSAATVRIDSNEGYPTFHLQPSSLRAFAESVALLTDTENKGVQLSMVNTTTNALTILATGSHASYGSTIAAMDSFILYLSGSPNTGQQLWRSDGTLSGTAMVVGLGSGVQFSQLGQNIVMTRVGDRAIFQAENAQNGPQLWSSDGTAQGTVPLIVTPTPSSSGYVQPLLGVAGTHGYYAVYNGTDFRVVVTDGTVAGTHVLTDAGPIDQNSVPGAGTPGAQVVAGDDTLAFLYIYHQDASGNTKHLYAYSPKSNSLTHLQDNDLADVASEPMLMYAAQLYFRGSDPVHSDTPWVSDGTVAGTHILLNLSNVAPIAGNDSASSEGAAAVTIDVLANDSESGGTIDTASVQIVSKPTHGDVSITSSGSVVYTPASGFAGSDSFTYTVKDVQGALSNVATVGVTVTAAASSSSGSGGGGSVTLLDLLAFVGFALIGRIRFMRYV